MTTASRAKRITMGEVRKRFKADGWRLDFHDKAYERRDASFYSLHIVEFRHTGRADQYVKVTWYRSSSGQHWESKDFRGTNALKDAVAWANKVKPQSDEIAAEELGESPEGKLAVDTTKKVASAYLKKAVPLWGNPKGEGFPGQAMAMYESLLALLRAMHWTHLTNHWTVSGSSFYGDHLLFERMYDGMTEEIDTLAEKLVAAYGGIAVSPSEQATMLAETLEKFAGASRNPYERALFAEEMLQDSLQTIFTEMENRGELGLGMNDFLAALASAHETNIYLLQQRLQETVKNAAEVGTDTATIFAIDPAQLRHLHQNPQFGELLLGGLGDNMEALEELVRMHGGATFATGKDGRIDVQVPGSREKGLQEPYGTSGYDPASIRVAARHIGQRSKRKS